MVERRVLAVDDDPAALDAIVTLLRKEGYEVFGAPNAEDAEALLERHRFLFIVTDLVLPGKSGIDLVRSANEKHPGTPAIVVTGHGTLGTAIEALKAGAVDYLTKPIDPQRIRELIRRSLEQANLPWRDAGPAEATELEGMVSRSPAMRAVFEKVLLASKTESTVLLQGESGSGKELCARAIHRRSPRANGPFVTVQVASIPRERLEEEFFGSSGGDATPGKVEQARGGTLFIEEIDSLDAPLQGRLLRLLETGTPFQAGAGQEGSVDLRLVVSTHRNLSELVREGRFREDLYYRLSIYSIDLPPLRERKEDIPLLVGGFLDLFATRYRKAAPTVPPQTLDILLRYSWPGNVRELRNVIEHAVILCVDGTLSPELLPRMLHSEESHREASIRIPIGTKMKEVERTVIARTLDAYRWNKNKTARILGISRRSLYNKLDRYRITRDGEQQGARENEGALRASPVAEGKGGA